MTAAILIFRIIGILFLVFSGIIILVLFLPVIYEIRGDTGQKRVSVHVSWLGRLIRFLFAWQGNITAVLSILFFRIDFTDPEKKKEREEKKAKKNRKKREKALKKRKRRNRIRRKKQKRTPVPDPEVTLSDPVRTDTEHSAEPSGQNPDKKTDISGTVSKIKTILSLAHEYEIVQTAGPKLIVFLKHIRPRVIEGRFQYGLKDPAVTGYITGGIASVPYIYEFDLTIIPDFDSDRNYISGTVYSRGHIQLIHVVILIIGLIRQKNIRIFISQVRRTNGRRSQNGRK